MTIYSLDILLFLFGTSLFHVFRLTEKLQTLYRVAIPPSLTPLNVNILQKHRTVKPRKLTWLQYYKKQTWWKCYQFFHWFPFSVSGSKPASHIALRCPISLWSSSICSSSYYLSVWLHPVLVAVHGIVTASSRIFFAAHRLSCCARHPRTWGLRSCGA